MFGKKETFRRAALERLSSPERLDEMMRNTPPKGWLALSTLGGLALLTLIWSFLGRLPSRVDGQGLLIPGRTQSVDAPASGIVTKIFVKPGEFVQVDQQVAVLTDPNAAGQLQSLQRELENLESDDRKAQQEEEVAKTQSENTYRINERTYRSQLAISETTRAQAAARLGRMEASGPAVYGEQQKAPLRSQIREADNQINSLRAQIESNKKQQQDEDNARNTERRRRQQKIEEKKGDIARKQLVQGQILKTTHAGRVFDVLVDEGSTATAKQMLVRIEELDQPLRAIVYVPAREGQSVKVEDEVQIAPSNVKKEEFGTMKGRVMEKGNYPMNKQGIINDIRNETLAEEFTKAGAPLRVEVELFRNEKPLEQDPELSGYVWTSGTGPKRKILSGTPCNSTVITGYGRPIDRAITWLKTTTGL
ncbi:MAG: NHLP bacteriocin system secretion protein [Verrucomicrobiales bacterium]